ncbi:MAG: efflux RND transporter periplasmic adaptor subunit [Myxococcales bacterium]|nr:efflux RND transporter periplasmic adaptor subunit [Myxococcales bacterium]MBK7196256.1 efflux RND transporter periplasmic adaptor subunit [Myxococcales bacterium]MBP6843209.1 efflux RND transporter periplasmic adaptor subunit [Kofleriaceae bacterium]
MRRASMAAALLLALAACGRGDRAAPAEHHDDHDDHDDHGAAAPHADGDHPAPPDRVEIAPEMRRDLRVTTARAEARPAGEQVAALGELQVNQDAYAEVAAPAPARVVKVLARAGDEVTLGQPLVELYSADAGLTRAEAQAAAARVTVARANLARLRGLAAERLVTEREVLEAEAALTTATAEAQVATAAARAYAGARGGAGLVLRAPVAGTVIARDVVIGQLADPARTLYRIGDLSTLWLVAHVFERDAVRLRVGSTGTATFAALPGRTIDGVVTWIGREVDAASRTIPVRMDVANADGVLRPGMSAMVALALGDSGGTVVTVPLAAVQRVDDAWVVFVPVGPGVFEARRVGRGRELAGELEILSGLAPGDEVVVDGAFLLKAEADKARGAGGGHDHH